MKLHLSLNKILWVTSGLTLLCGLYFLSWWRNDIDIANPNLPDIATARDSSDTPACQRAGQRPIAVMLAGDPEARPLSGIQAADIVVEMPVTPNGITRFMAVYQCQTPTDIGSIRSAREDFIPLAAGMNAILVHWGGEHGALEKLNKHVVDNIDALIYEGTVFYRKKGTKAPHNGFTSFDQIIDKAKKLKYDLSTQFVGYTRAAQPKNIKNLTNLASTANINYPAPYNVQWTYNEQRNLYTRTRGGTPEQDALTSTQVTTAAVVIMETTAQPLRDQYLQVHVTGTGNITVYQQGTVSQGTWHKDPASLTSKLQFFDAQGKEFMFVPGTLWIEIVL